MKQEQPRRGVSNLLKAVSPTLEARRGTLLYEKVAAPALKGNLLGDAAVRDVIIYLPPGYEKSPTRRYPVVTMLHGYGGNSGACWFWTGGGYIRGLKIAQIAESLMSSGQVQPMILVLPDGTNQYWGAMYNNSVTVGNHRTFIARDLREWVDANFRTLPDRESRGIMGHSMGGMGCMTIATLESAHYSAVYAMSGMLAYDDEEIMADADLWQRAMKLTRMDQFNTSSTDVQVLFAMAAAFTPNPDAPPFYVSFPVRSTPSGVALDEPLARKFNSQWALAYVDEYQEALRMLAIRFDVGRRDSYTWGVTTNKMYDAALTARRIPHQFEIYEGTHHSRIKQRIATHVLPFFSETLVGEVSKSRPRRVR